MTIANVPHQHEIDAISAAMLRGDIALLESIAWQACKDGGLDYPQNITPQTIRRIVDALNEETK